MSLLYATGKPLVDGILTGSVRILAIPIPCFSIGPNVVTDAFQGIVVPDNVFPIISLPEAILETRPTLGCHLVAVSGGRHGFEPLDHVRQ